jgi:hypothetical protein
MFLNPRFLGIGIAIAISSQTFTAKAQSTSTLTLDSFNNNKGSWSQVGEAWADPTLSQNLMGDGQGVILLNKPSKKTHGSDIVSTEEFGDVQLTLLYMMAKGSNSGIYLQGQYEIQLLDSWEEKKPAAGSNGGVYERWDDSKPDGEKGYQGYAPRQNVSKAPGIWQTLEVSFQAPRFGTNGQKTENAKFRSIKLNGVLIHENLELFGPTRGALKAEEVAKGPIRIQGDHGSVAIKLLEVKKIDISSPEVSTINYEVYEGSFMEMPSVDKLKIESNGSIDSFDDFHSEISGASITKFTGMLDIKQAGNYTFDVNVPRGFGALKIGTSSEPVGLSQATSRVEKSLSAGKIPYELWVSKPREWAMQGFNMTASAEGMWPVSLSKPLISYDNSADPIYVDAEQTPVLRSFIQLPGGKKISHAVSIAGTGKTHFTYDLGSNQLIRVWRGEFLDATPMWDSRGNGISVPRGAVTYLNTGDPLLLTSAFADAKQELKSKGYTIISNGNMQFDAATSTGAKLTDHIKIMENGDGISREIEISDQSQTFMIMVIPGKSLKEISKNLYLVEDTGAYIQVLTDGVKPQQGNVNSTDGIYLPLKSKLSYAVLF